MILMCTDTSLVAEQGNVRTGVFDGASKWRHWRYGWMAGAGAHEIIASVEQTMANGRFTDIDDLELRISRAWEEAAGRLVRFPEAAEVIRQTGVQFTMGGVS
jgi:hypothetical protein